MDEIKIGLGEYMGEFYRSISPNTKALQEFIGRGLSKSIAYAPARMIDSAEEMLASWRKNDNAGDGTSSPYLPVILIALGKDYMPASDDYSIQVGDPQCVILPEDPKERVFKMTQMQGDRRAQLVIFAADEPTARSIAMQFAMYVFRPANRRFSATYRFAGQDLGFPVMLETSDVPATNVATDQKNLTILAIDLSLLETIPLFKAPRDDEPNDGLGTVGNPDDPSGYSMVEEVDLTDARTVITRVVTT